MEGKVKQGDYYIKSFEEAHGKHEILERDCGDYIEIANIKGVIESLPGFVAAFGGIPDELKIDGGISFSIPIAPFKITKNLPEDARRYEEMHGQRCAMECLKRPGGWKEEWEYGDDIHIRPHMIKMEFNIAPTPGLWKGLTTPNLNQLQEAMEGSESVKEGHMYYLQSQFQCDHALLGCYSRDSFLFTLFRGLLINQPGIVAVVGGIPYGRKLNGGISFWFPSPVFKFPTKLIEDPNERLKFDGEEFMAKQEWSNALLQAYKKAVGISSSFSSVCEEAPFTDRHRRLVHTSVEVNLGKGEADILELCDSLWAIFYHSIHKTIFTNEMDKSEGVQPTFGSLHSITGNNSAQRLKLGAEYFAYSCLMVRAVRKKKPSYSCSINKQDDQQVEEQDDQQDEEQDDQEVEEPMPKRRCTVKVPIQDRP